MLRLGARDLPMSAAGAHALSVEALCVTPFSAAPVRGQVVPPSDAKPLEATATTSHTEQPCPRSKNPPFLLSISNILHFQ